MLTHYIAQKEAQKTNRATKQKPNQPNPTENGRTEKKKEKEKRKGKKIRKRGKEVKWLHKDHPACTAVEAELMGFLTYQPYQALNTVELQLQGVPQRAAKVSRTPQIQMVCSAVYSTLCYWTLTVYFLTAWSTPGSAHRKQCSEDVNEIKRQGKMKDLSLLGQVVLLKAAKKAQFS